MYGLPEVTGNIIVHTHPGPMDTLYRTYELEGGPRYTMRGGEPPMSALEANGRAKPGQRVRLGVYQFRVQEYVAYFDAYVVVLDRLLWRRFLLTKHWQLFQLRVLLTLGIWGLAKKHSPMQDSALPTWNDVHAVRWARRMLVRKGSGR